MPIDAVAPPGLGVLDPGVVGAVSLLVWLPAWLAVSLLAGPPQPARASDPTRSAALQAGRYLVRGMDKFSSVHDVGMDAAVRLCR